jgi:type IV secretory pathway VirJ component
VYLGLGKTRPGLAAALALAVALGGCSPRSASTAAGRLGDVRVFGTEGAADGIVFLFGTGDGWSSADDAAARRLAAAGATVVGIKLGQYRRQLAGARDSCLYLVGDVEQASRAVERRLGFTRYIAPILAGMGEAGALAGAMLAQAPAGAIAGAVVIDPAAAIDFGRPICTAPPRDVGVPGTPGFLLAAFSGEAPPAGKAVVVRARTAGKPVEIAPLPVAASRTESLALLAASRIGAVAAPPARAAIGDLPLVELPPTRSGVPLVVVLSGDGGWRDIDKVIADALHERGLAVVGWNSLSYFWTARTPAQLARDLASALAYYAAKWRTGRVVLVGYSFGADVLPFALNRLPAELRARIVQLSLLGYAGKADFEIHVAGWIDRRPTAAALPGAAEMARIDPRQVQCFYGAEESDSACPSLAASGAEVVKMAGGHHLGGDYEAVAARIAEGLARRGLPLQ